MTWNIEFLEEAKMDLKKLDHSVQLQVVKGIEKVRKNYAICKTVIKSVFKRSRTSIRNARGLKK